MAQITPKISKKVEKIARKLTVSDKDVFWDAYQEGLQRICEMSNGHTESYYVQYAYRRIQDFLRKERRYHSRNLSLSAFVDQSLDNCYPVSAYKHSTRHVEWSAGDYVTQKFLDGKEG